MNAMEVPEIVELSGWRFRAPARNIPADPQAVLDTAEAALDARSTRAWRAMRRRLGASAFDAMRAAEPFAGMSDIQVGDALAPGFGRSGMTELAIRGLGYAAAGPPAGMAGEPIKMNRVFLYARNTAERTLFLESLAQLVERPGGPPDGTFRMLADMTSSRTSWRGGLWTLTDMQSGRVFGVNDVLAFERTETRTWNVNGEEVSVERRYDVVLRDSTKIEHKSWTHWFPDSVRSQFARDVLILTERFADPRALRRMRWRFEQLPGQTEVTHQGPRHRTFSESEARQAIEEQMEAGLEEALERGGASARQRALVREAFEDYVDDIIQLPDSP